MRKHRKVRDGYISFCRPYRARVVTVSGTNPAKSGGPTPRKKTVWYLRAGTGTATNRHPGIFSSGPVVGGPGLRMRLVEAIPELRECVSRARGRRERIALVPTMGAFHEGHLSLMRRARADCDFVVVSLFVNPSQFGAGEDLASYPRDRSRDAALAREQGVDALF